MRSTKGQSAGWGDLVNLKYDQFDCYDVARLAAARFGVELPARPEDLLAGVESVGVELGPGRGCRPGDLLEMRGEDGPHIGVCLDAFTFLHATREGGSRIDRIDAHRRAGLIVRVVRPRALLAAEEPAR